MANNATSRIARLERAEAHLQRTKDGQPELVVYDPTTGSPPAADPRRPRVLIPDNGRLPITEAGVISKKLPPHLD